MTISIPLMIFTWLQQFTNIFIKKNANNFLQKNLFKFNFPSKE